MGSKSKTVWTERPDVATLTSKTAGVFKASDGLTFSSSEKGWKITFADGTVKRLRKTSITGFTLTEVRKKSQRKRQPRKCECGCGGMTKGGRFLPGHDAKLKGCWLKTMRDESELPAVRAAALIRLVGRGWAQEPSPLPDWAETIKVALEDEIAEVSTVLKMSGMELSAAIYDVTGRVIDPNKMDMLETLNIAEIQAVRDLLRNR